MSVLAGYLNQLRWSYRKNRPDIRGIVGGHYPTFVLARECRTIRDEVPVFVFHQVEPARFRTQLEYLARNGYTTLTGDALLDVLDGKTELPEHSVVLTFDDGTASLYTVAYPLLREYNFRAIGFIVPGCIPNSAPQTPTYEDVQAGRAEPEDLLRRESGEFPLCSWQEIHEMHASGFIEFQAHSMHHQLIHISSELIDFVHPGYDGSIANFNVPVRTVDGFADCGRDVQYGAPVLRYEPRMSGVPQYVDHEMVHESCIGFVNDHGGAAFFERRDWRKKLTEVYRQGRQRWGYGRCETEGQVRQAIFSDLKQCKAVIENRLPGTTVEHFCFPWYIGSSVAVEEAQEVGYRALHWGMLDESKTNRPGGNPLRIVRLEDRYIYRLPGTGRKPLTRLLGEKMMANIARTF